jgi:hypothetical protein
VPSRDSKKVETRSGMYLIPDPHHWSNLNLLNLLLTDPSDCVYPLRHGRRNFKDTSPLMSSLLVIFVRGGEAIL